MMIRTHLRSLIALPLSLLSLWQLLIAQSKKILADSQKIIDSETTKRLNELHHLINAIGITCRERRLNSPWARGLYKDLQHLKNDHEWAVVLSKPTRCQNERPN